eukprot:5156278-Pleurochrysis_carterae.AAC.2
MLHGATLDAVYCAQACSCADAVRRYHACTPKHVAWQHGTYLHSCPANVHDSQVPKWRTQRAQERRQLFARMLALRPNGSKVPAHIHRHARARYRQG